MKKTFFVLATLVVLFTASITMAELKECSPATGTPGIVSQARIERIADRADIDEILSTIQDPNANAESIDVYYNTIVFPGMNTQTIIVRYDAGLMRAFGVITDQMTCAASFTKKEFIQAVYLVKVEEIAAAKTIDGSFKFVQTVNNNASLPDETREETRTGRFAGVESREGRDFPESWFPRVLLEGKGAKKPYEIHLCDVTFSTNRHPAELAMLQAWQVFICGHKVVVPVEPKKPPVKQLLKKVFDIF